MNDVRMLSIEMTIPVGNLIFFKLFSNSEMPDDRVVLFLLSGAGDRQRRSSRPPNPPIGGVPGQLWGPKLV